MDKKKKPGLIEIEGAEILFRNLSGIAGQFNAEGNRNFCVLLHPEDVPRLVEEGWNVKWLNAREPGDEDVPYLKVKVRYDNYPPKIILITGGGKTLLNEDTVSLVDWADIQNVDLIITPSYYDVNGKQGWTAYVKSMYVTVVDDAFEHKYYDIQESANRCMTLNKPSAKDKDD